MEPQDAAERIGELAEARPAERAAARAAEAQREAFRRRGALAIAVLAMLLAITSLGGQNATKEALNASVEGSNYNVSASDTWAFFQSKTIRQHALRLAVDELELRLPALPPDQQAEAQRTLAGYRATIARYESEPDPAAPADPLKGEGRTELTARARDYEAKRDHALEKRDRALQQDPNFDLAGALFQIGIVLGSVALLAASRAVLGLGLALGAVATVLLLNGFFLWFKLPLG